MTTMSKTYDPSADGIICAATLADAAADPALTLGIARELLREAAEAIRCLHQYRDAMGGQGEVRPCTCHPDDSPPTPCPRRYALSECRRAAQQPEARVGGEVAAGEPSAAAMAQAFIERYESRYTPHTVELVMAEVRARARELDTTPEECHALSVERWRRLLAAEAENERLRKALRNSADALERLAFAIRAPNAHTPQLVELAIAMRAAARAREG